MPILRMDNVGIVFDDLDVGAARNQRPTTGFAAVSVRL
jgi:hypothetical protein